MVFGHPVEKSSNRALAAKSDETMSFGRGEPGLRLLSSPSRWKKLLMRSCPCKRCKRSNPVLGESRAFDLGSENHADEDGPPRKANLNIWPGPGGGSGGVKNPSFLTPTKTISQ